MPGIVAVWVVMLPYPAQVQAAFGVELPVSCCDGLIRFHPGAGVDDRSRQWGTWAQWRGATSSATARRMA